MNSLFNEHICLHGVYGAFGKVAKEKTPQNQFLTKHSRSFESYLVSIIW